MPRRRPPLKFFLLVFALSVPFALIGVLAPQRLMPGLPVSRLMFFCPALAASIFVYREDGAAGVTGMLKRSIDYKRIKSKVWLSPAVLLMPAVSAIAYGLMRLLAWPVPTPRFPLPGTVALLAAFFVGALGEELGWSG